MDPVSAIGFAVTILTFVDFSWNLVKGSYQVYQSVTITTADNARLSTVLADLKKVTDAIQHDVKGNSPHLEDLRQLAAGCAELSLELSSILETLKKKEGNKVWRNLQAKWKHMKEVPVIEQRLNVYRLQLLLRLNLILSEQQSSVKSQLDEIQDSGLSLSAESLDNLTNLAKSVESLIQKLIKELSELVRRNDDKTISSLVEIRGSLSAILSQMEAIPKLNTAEECLLRRLSFPSMHSRLDTVSEAEMGTFAWLLEDEMDRNDEDSKTSSEAKAISNTSESSITHHVEANNEDTDSECDEEDSEISSTAEVIYSTDISSIEYSREQRSRQQVRRSFLGWLRSGGGIYHISGKAGSGKSTLMKFLCQNPRLRSELEEWAGDKKLVFANFFFWASGDKQQRSLEGLYRSLLFEILNQCPEFINEVFPDQWANMKSHLTRWEGRPFLLSELRQAMGIVTAKCNFPRHRFFFFIDGLDEYEGDSTDHFELARGLQKWSFSADIKICTSSRPHTEFLDVFDSNLRMDLHHLTRADIHRFIVAMFEKEQNFDSTNKHCRYMVQNIVNGADGVFLWVRLVVRSLLVGFRHRYPLAHLEQRLERMPRELDSLFERIFNSIDPVDRKKTDQMLILTASYPGINALMFSWLDDLEDPDFPFNAPIEAYSDDEIRGRLEVVRLHLDGLTKGILEIGHDYSPYIRDIYFQYKVEFFHRTAKDYFNEPARYAEITERLSDFDIMDAYRRLVLAEFKFARTMGEYFKTQALGGTQLISCFSKVFDGVADRVADQAPLRFHKEYDKILNHHRQHPFSFPGETTDNSGVIAWGQRFSSVNDYANAVAGDDISYLHWAASTSQHEYIVDQVLSNPKLVNPTDDGRSLLFSAIILGLYEPARGLICDLLKYGASPNHRIPVYSISSTDIRIASIWAIFLFIVGQKCLGHESKNVEMFWVMEELIKSGADSDVHFLLKPKRQEYDVEADSVEDIRFISLEDLVVKERPPNMDTLLGRIVSGKRFRLWNRILRALSTLVLWNILFADIESKYERARIDKLNSECDILCVYVGGERLDRDFSAKRY
ncbi:hypothetical protein EYB26_008123 [Talaromyces marneffei]|uniref:uncharacterized protein n=1 Tax=Talaromyces marneffei TaxID=37727 RepID=UPI0012A94B56|nr:uncharacterized protein EYB26_008123 [Talaromyces marneffei]QGA20421.1 hypothetical protein EYB26_008123 [Talaromyces marneffei]